MHKWITVLFLMAAGMQAAPAPHVQFGDPDRRAKLGSAFADIDRMFAEFAKTAHVPGAAWGIVIDGELAHSGAAGVREVATNAPVDADTVFRIASMTKSFTAMAILKLRDEGKLALDDPAERYVPELKGLRYPTTDSPRITIRHLLTHSEGFPEDNPWGDQQLSESEASCRGCCATASRFRMRPASPTSTRTTGLRSSAGSCRRCPAAVRRVRSQNILQPLGMTSTTLHPSKVAADRRAVGYRWEDERWKEEPALPHGSFGAMGGMLTSIRDLSRYVSALPRGVAAAGRAGDAARSAGRRSARCSSPGVPPACASCSTSRRAPRT